MPEHVYASNELMTSEILQNVKIVKDHILNQVKQKEIALKAQDPGAPPPTKIIIDKEMARKAIIAAQFQYNFWKFPRRLAIFFKNNSEGPVTWDDEYIAYMLSKDRASEKSAQETRLKRIQEDWASANKFTISSQDKKVVTSKPKEPASGGKGKDRAKARVQVVDDPIEAVDDQGVPDPESGPGPAPPRPSTAKSRAPPSGQGGAAAAGAAPSTTFQLPVQGSTRMVKSMKRQLEIFARYSNTMKHMYCLAVPLDQVQTHKGNIEQLGYMGYKDITDQILSYGDEIHHELIAKDIFTSRLGYSMFSMCGFTYKHMPTDSYLTEELKQFVVPFEVAKLRAKFLSAYYEDAINKQDPEDPAEACMHAIDKAWETFSQPEAHAQCQEMVKETLRLNKLEAAYKKSFDKLFNTMPEITARNLLAKELIEKLRLNEGQHEQNVNNQIMEITKNGGIKDEQLLTRANFLRYLEVFVGSLPTLLPGDGFSKKMIVEYLDGRDTVIQICENLTTPGYIAKLEAEHKKKIPEIIKSDENPGIWARYRREYKAYTIAIQHRDEAEKNAAKEKEEQAKLLKEREDEIALLKQQLANFGGIQASAQGADGGQAPGDQGAQSKRRRTGPSTGPSRPRTRGHSPPLDFAPEKTKRVSNPPTLLRPGRD